MEMEETTTPQPDLIRAVNGFQSTKPPAAVIKLSAKFLRSFTQNLHKMARLRPEDDILIAEMKAGGATLQEIANAFGISKHAAWLHTKKSREIIRELKKNVLMHYLDEALLNLDYLENCAMAEFERAGENDPKWIGTILAIIRERSKLLDLSGFVREQRAAAGTAPTLILHEDDAGLYAELDTAAACGKF